MKYPVDKLIGKYIELRNKKSAIKAKADEEILAVEKDMELIETALKVQANEQGVTSFKTTAGTMYLTNVDRVNVSDWSETLKYILENKRYDLLTRGVNKTAVKEFVETNNIAPPGVNFSRSVGVNIRKPSVEVDSLGE